jgi:hypothetical protein
VFLHFITQDLNPWSYNYESSALPLCFWSTTTILHFTSLFELHSILNFKFNLCFFLLREVARFEPLIIGLWVDCSTTVLQESKSRPTCEFFLSRPHCIVLFTDVLYHTSRRTYAVDLIKCFILNPSKLECLSVPRLFLANLIVVSKAGAYPHLKMLHTQCYTTFYDHILRIFVIR